MPRARGAATLDEFFTELGPDRSAQIQSADVFHVVKLVGDALDEVPMRSLETTPPPPEDQWAKDFKGSLWAPLKYPDDLTDRQVDQLARIRRTRGGIWRAYELTEQFRAIFAGNLTATKPQ